MSRHQNEICRKLIELSIELSNLIKDEYDIDDHFFSKGGEDVFQEISTFSHNTLVGSGSPEAKAVGMEGNHTRSEDCVATRTLGSSTSTWKSEHIREKVLFKEKRPKYQTSVAKAL